MNKNKTIKVDNFTIGSSRTFIIAEVGSNFCQDVKIAKESIDAAIASGADAVKFQSLNVDKLYLNPSEEIIKLHKKIDFDEKLHSELKNYCDKKGTIFFSSPTYLQSVDILEDINIKLYKLASAQVGTFPQIVEKVAKLGKPVLFSTGLTSYSELDASVGVFKKAGNDKFIILHCNSIYPTPYDKINLHLIRQYKALYGNPVGFSDHSLNSATSIAAVALGACVIEKHFTLDRKLPSPDAELSFEPSDFKKMVDEIRLVELSLQSTLRTEIEPEEIEFKEKILYRLILKKNKKNGDMFFTEDFEYKRHPSGVDCRDIGIVLNRMKAKTDIKKGALLEWNMLSGR